MSGPWYECQGPDAAYVRKHQLVRYKQQLNADTRFTDNMITEILEKVIPDGTTGFGSFRGYATFGLDDNLKSQIEAEIEIKRSELNHRRRMSDTFIEIQFMPGGSGYIETKNHFENIVSDIKANSYEMISAPEESANEQEKTGACDNHPNHIMK
jgi:hypothetical protein